MVTDLNEAPSMTHARRRTQKTIGLAERIEVLKARLGVCVVTLETLIELNKVDPAFHETMQRVIRHGNEALANAN